MKYTYTRDCRLLQSKILVEELDENFEPQNSFTYSLQFSHIVMYSTKNHIRKARVLEETFNQMR